MTTPNYNLIKKHITPDVVTYRDNMKGLFFDLYLPMSGNLTIAQASDPADTYTIGLTELMMKVEVGYVQPAQGGVECIEFEYEYDESHYEDPDVRDYVSNNKAVLFMISTALVNAGFSPQAAAELKEVDSEIHGSMYFAAPMIRKEIIAAMSEQVVMWELGSRELIA